MVFCIFSNEYNVKYRVINNTRVYNKTSFIREDRPLIVNSMKCTALDLARSLQLSDTNLSAIL